MPNFTALTLNMQNGEPWADCVREPTTPDLKGTINFLRAHPTDLLFLQEVEAGNDGGGQAVPPPNFTALESALPGLQAVFGYPEKNPDEIPFGLGLAIFSRFPLSDFWQENLPAPDCRFEFGGRMRNPSQRLLIGARTEIGGKKLEILNTHLQAFFMIGTSSDEHRGQRDAIERHLRASPPATLLAGDFNCAPEEGLLAQFVSTGFSPAQTERPTWRRRPYVVDHLLSGPGLKLLDCEVIPTKASDHHAVRATYSFLQ